MKTEKTEIKLLINGKEILKELISQDFYGNFRAGIEKGKVVNYSVKQTKRVQ